MEMGSPGGPSMTLPGVADATNDKLFMLQMVEDDFFFMNQLIGTGAATWDTEQVGGGPFDGTCADC